MTDYRLRKAWPGAPAGSLLVEQADGSHLYAAGPLRFVAGYLAAQKGKRGADVQFVDAAAVDWVPTQGVTYYYLSPIASGTKGAGFTIQSRSFSSNNNTDKSNLGWYNFFRTPELAQAFLDEIMLFLSDDTREHG